MFRKVHSLSLSAAFDDWLIASCYSQLFRIHYDSLRGLSSSLNKSRRILNLLDFASSRHPASLFRRLRSLVYSSTTLVYFQSSSSSSLRSTADLFAQSKGVEIRFLFLLSPSYSCRVNLSHPVKFISEG